MGEIIIAIVVVTVIGILCSVMLVAASHFMEVPVDEKEKKLRECLPGVNCGACESECPVGAISDTGSARTIDADKCISCGACAGTCPTGAIVEA